jgi:hypothetical protein
MLAKFFDQLVHETAYDDDMTFSMDSLAIMGLVSNICFWVGGVASIVALRKISALALQLQVKGADIRHSCIYFELQ